MRCCRERLLSTAVLATAIACGARSTYEEAPAVKDDAGVSGDGCARGATRDCYSGPEGTAGVGTCLAGVQVCVDGSWSVCSGEVGPRSETCDRTDENCDGEVDEGFPTLECGPCRGKEDECSCVGSGCEPFDLDGSESVAVVSGALVPAGAHGTWSHLFEGQCESVWNAVHFDADTPGDADVEVFGRGDVRWADPDAVPWQRLGSFREDGLVLPTPWWTDNLQIRVEMYADPVDSSARPVIRWLSACWCWVSCTL